MAQPKAKEPAVLTLAEFEAILEAYRQEVKGLDPLYHQNQLVWRTELNKIRGDPRIVLMGQVVTFLFSVETIFEQGLVHLRASPSGKSELHMDDLGYLLLKLPEHQYLPNAFPLGLTLYWKVGRDLTLSDAEKLRRGDVFPVKIRLKRSAHESDESRNARDCRIFWHWEFIDYPWGKYHGGETSNLTETIKRGD